VGDDGKIADVVHDFRDWLRAAGSAVKPLQQKLKSRSEMKARSAVLRLKKRHVEVVTRLPTERLATACWATIVAKSIRLEPAPMLDFRPLQAANTKIHSQVIHRFVTLLWTSDRGSGSGCADW
jgi:hypothetical protein